MNARSAVALASCVPLGLVPLLGFGLMVGFRDPLRYLHGVDGLDLVVAASPGPIALLYVGAVLTPLRFRYAVLLGAVLLAVPWLGLGVYTSYTLYQLQAGATSPDVHAILPYVATLHLARVGCMITTVLAAAALAFRARVAMAGAALVAVALLTLWAWAQYRFWAVAWGVPWVWDATGVQGAAMGVAIPLCLAGGLFACTRPPLSPSPPAP